jgi:hypothetical protein
MLKQARDMRQKRAFSALGGDAKLCKLTYHSSH